MKNDPTNAERQARYRARHRDHLAKLEAEVKRLRAEVARLRRKDKDKNKRQGR
jgi:hypothetical protein